MSPPTWRVTVTREDGYWVAVVNGLRGGATETRRLDRVEEEVRDLVAWLTDTADSAFDLTWEYQLPTRLTMRVRAFTEKRDGLRRAQEEYDIAARAVVAEARAEAISVRDTGALLGLSHQRVQQIDAGQRHARTTRAYDSRSGAGTGASSPGVAAKKSAVRAAGAKKSAPRDDAARATA
jgi:hypothetical protein